MFSDTSLQHPPTVLVFDSGVGGLSVYQEIRQMLPGLHFIYAFDNAFFPYGEKSEQVIVERVLNIVKSINQVTPLDMVVIACNTASTVALPVLREQFGFSVVGVVPAIKPAAQLTRNGVVGLLATRATVQRQYTHDLINQFAQTCKVEMLGSAQLVEIAEAKLHGETVDLEALREILFPWLSEERCPDTIVLGCTHFPLLKDELKIILPGGTELVDSGPAIARRVTSLLGNQYASLVLLGGNQVYYTLQDAYVGKLTPVFKQYGFSDFALLTL